MMDFSPIVSPDLREMDAALFRTDGPCGLAESFGA